MSISSSEHTPPADAPTDAAEKNTEKGAQKDTQKGTEADGQEDAQTSSTRESEDGVIPTTSSMRLDHFLQRCGLAQTGGHAKQLIQTGQVHLNGEVETRRRKQVRPGDVVACGGDAFEMTAD